MNRQDRHELLLMFLGFMSGAGFGFTIGALAVGASR